MVQVTKNLKKNVKISMGKRNCRIVNGKTTSRIKLKRFSKMAEALQVKNTRTLKI